MSIKSILKEVIRTATFWMPTSNPPRWVKRASEKYERAFERRYGHRPYDIIKHFRGKNRLYKVFYECVAQGQIEDKWYWKPRI